LLKNNDYDCNNLFQFANTYKPIHGYLSAILCIFGIPSNILNIIVLTRPNLITSPTNLILTTLATSDLLTMCSVLPYTIWFYIIYSESHFCKPISLMLERDTKFWTILSLIHVNFSVTVHSISIWLTVYLAVFRYIYLQSSSLSIETTQYNDQMTTKNHFKNFLINFRNYNSCLKWIISICFFCLVFCSPAYFIYYVDKELVGNTTSSYVYLFNQTKLNRSTNGFIFNLTFYTQAIFAKLIPCILLVTFSLLLIRSLVVINRNNRKLKQCHTLPLLPKNSARDSLFIKISKKFTPVKQQQQLSSLQIVKKQSRNRTKENLRTTLMLVIVCVLFLITELPQCILIFLSIILKKQDFYERVYMPLGDIMDIIALLNNSINFLLYCIMSRAFRTTFYSLVVNFTRGLIFWKKSGKKVSVVHREGDTINYTTVNS
jgi:hypothetical protein